MPNSEAADSRKAREKAWGDLYEADALADIAAASRCANCGHTRKAHTSVLPPEGACYMPGCTCNGFSEPHSMGDCSFAASGRQPVSAYKCSRCGKISETEWSAGRHRIPEGGMTEWCSGLPEQFYLVSVDEYLDVMLAVRNV